jgi:hypothetical protein
MLDDIQVELEGEIDLPGFLGLEPPENLNMDKLPGYKSIKANVKLKGDADPKALQELHEHVIKTSPVGVTLTRPIAVSTSLEVGSINLTADPLQAGLVIKTLKSNLFCLEIMPSEAIIIF